MKITVIVSGLIAAAIMIITMLTVMTHQADATTNEPKCRPTDDGFACSGGGSYHPSNPGGFGSHEDQDLGSGEGTLSGGGGGKIGDPGGAGGRCEFTYTERDCVGSRYD